PILFLSVALLPVYLWESGGLQLSHYLLALYALFFIAANGLQVTRSDLTIFAVFLVVLIRESVAVGGHLEVSAFMPAVHVLYCLFVFNVLRRAFLSARTVSALVPGVTLAAAIAVS